MITVAPLIRERAMPVDAWDEPVRVHTEALGKALGIDWTKYISRIDTQKSRAIESSPSTSGRGTSSARSQSLSARKKTSYTRDGRKIDNSMRSAEEAALIERVQGHSTLGAPSSSHPSVAKYIGDDGTPLITPRSTSITPRSVALTPRVSSSTPRASSSTPRSLASRGMTPRSARGSSSTPCCASTSGGVDGDALRKALSPAAFGLTAVGSAPPTSGGAKRPAPSAKVRKQESDSRGTGTAKASVQGSNGTKRNGDATTGISGVAEAATNRAQLQAQLQEARQRRKALSRPLQQALAANLSSSAATHLAEQVGTRIASSDEWHDSVFRRTHINYRAFLKPNVPRSLGDLQTGSIRVPLHGGMVESKHANGSVVNHQGSRQIRRHSLVANTALPPRESTSATAVLPPRPDTG